jgi:hypothetical protein
MKYILALLLLLTAATPARADGPLFSIWHIDGHGYQWQQNQIDAGLPLETSVRMTQFAASSGVNKLAQLEADAAILQRFSGRSIVLRMNNITNEIDFTIPRPAVTEETVSLSHMCVRRLADGSLDSMPVPYILEDHTAQWAQVGTAWASSPWMVRLQQIVTEPTGIILRENNEGPRMSFAKFYVKKNVLVRNSNGKLVQASKNDDPSRYADPVGPEWFYRIESAGVRAYRWLYDAECDAIDIRLKTWVGLRRSTFPPDCLLDFEASENSHYAALYNAFDAALSPEWTGKLRTCAYGGWSEGRQADTASVTFYLGFFVPTDLTDPKYQSIKFGPAEAEYASQAWREWSISIYPDAVFEGAKLGRHAVVDPESYAGFMSHALWRMQSPGQEVRMTYWRGYLTKPDRPILASIDRDVEGISDVRRQAVIDLGRPDLLERTVGDYEVAVMQAMDRIHDHPVINRFWREGSTVLLSSPLNTATATKVYATETSIPGETATLLCVYTPCDLSGEIPVGGWTVRAKRLGYWLTGSVQEIE